MALKLAFIFFSMILVNNYVLVKFLGICPFLGVSGKLNSSVGMSVAVIFVMFLATAVTWPVYTYLLVPSGLEFLNNICFILIIAVLVQLVEIVLRKFIPPLYKSLGIYLPLITTNCAVLGAAILMQTNNLDLMESLINTLGYGFGFVLALMLMAGIRERLETVHMPKAMSGTPVALVLAGLMSLAFMAFKGMV